MVPKQLSSDLWVFGAQNGGWFKMRAVNGLGQKIHVGMYTNLVSSLSSLTLGVYNGAATVTSAGLYADFYDVSGVSLGPCP